MSSLFGDRAVAVAIDGDGWGVSSGSSGKRTLERSRVWRCGSLISTASFDRSFMSDNVLWSGRPRNAATFAGHLLVQYLAGASVDVLGERSRLRMAAPGP